jgi:site-specific recombinase XerD
MGTDSDDNADDHETNSGDDSTNPDGNRKWMHNLNVLQETGKGIIEEWRAENPDSPRDYPTVQWLRENGYSHIRWILREKHDMGTPEFFILITAAGGSEEFEWDLDDVATIERIKAYLAEKVDYRRWTSSTKRTQRARIKEVLRRFVTEYGEENILAIANEPERETAVYEAFKQVIHQLRRDLTTDDSTYQYVRATHRFFEWLARSGRITYDPMEDIEDEFNFDRSNTSVSLTAEQIQKLWTVAETDEERMLVIGYCIWGVRTKELPAVHINQITLDVGDPYIEFEDPDRKNGQGQVSIIFGLDSLADLVHKRLQQSDWNGYLFPSNKAGRSSLSGKQMRERFKDLCRKADVTVDGEVPTPKHGRAFYYNILAKAETDLLEVAEEIAAEQGSEDAEAVRDFYLTSEQRRQYRQIFFRQHIRQILPDDAHTEYNEDTDSDTSLDNFE